MYQYKFTGKSDIQYSFPYEFNLKDSFAIKCFTLSPKLFTRHGFKLFACIISFNPFNNLGKWGYYYYSHFIDKLIQNLSKDTNR